MSVDLGSLEMNTLCVQVSKKKLVNTKKMQRYTTLLANSFILYYVYNFIRSILH